VAVDEATCLLPLRRVPMAHISTESLRATQDLARILVLSPEVGRQVHFSDSLPFLGIKVRRKLSIACIYQFEKPKLRWVNLHVHQSCFLCPDEEISITRTVANDTCLRVDGQKVPLRLIHYFGSFLLSEACRRHS